ncbi:MAG: hypothetical protein QXW10_04655 [Candidatus Micrarchaeaceae archaeon]
MQTPEVQYYHDVLVDLIAAWKGIHRKKVVVGSKHESPPVDEQKIVRLKRRLPRALQLLQDEISRLPTVSTSQTRHKAKWRRNAVLLAAFVNDVLREDEVKGACTDERRFLDLQRLETNEAVVSALEKVEFVFEEAIALETALSNEENLDTLLFALLGNLNQRIAEVSDVLADVLRSQLVKGVTEQTASPTSVDDDVLWVLRFVEVEARRVGAQLESAVVRAHRSCAAAHGDNVYQPHSRLNSQHVDIAADTRSGEQLPSSIDDSSNAKEHDLPRVDAAQPVIPQDSPQSSQARSSCGIM